MGPRNRTSFTGTMAVVLLVALLTIHAVPLAQAAGTDLSSWCPSSMWNGSRRTCTLSNYETVATSVIVSNGETFLVPPNVPGDPSFTFDLTITGSLTVASGGNLTVAEAGTTPTAYGPYPTEGLELWYGATLTTEAGGTFSLDGASQSGGESLFGTVNNYGTTKIGGSDTTANSAAFNNYGTFYNSGGFDQYGTFNNQGAATNSGVIYQKGTWNEYCAGSLTGNPFSADSNAPIDICFATTTTVDCAPSPVTAGTSTTCTADVVGSGSPSGAVDFTSSSATGTFSPSPSSTVTSYAATFFLDCSTSPAGLNASVPGTGVQCLSSGDLTVNGTYSGSDQLIGGASSESVYFTVSGIWGGGPFVYRVVDLSQGSTVIANGSATYSSSYASAACSNSISGTGTADSGFQLKSGDSVELSLGVPRGQYGGVVTVCSGGGTGTDVGLSSLSANDQCALSSGSCSVTYVDSTPGTPTITAAYGVESDYRGSSGTFALTVKSPTTSTTTATSQTLSTSATTTSISTSGPFVTTSSQTTTNASAMANPWPMFQGSPQQTGLSPFVGPSSPTVLWNVSLAQGDPLYPVLGKDGSIYVEGYGYNNNVYGEFISAIGANGVSEWNYTVPFDDGAIIAQPAVGSDGTIYFMTNSGLVYALNPGGTVKWTLATPGGSSDQGNECLGGFFDRCSTVIGPGGTIYVERSIMNATLYQNDAGFGPTYLYSISPGGTLNWSYTVDPAGVTYGSYAPAVGTDGTVYALGDNGTAAFLLAISPPGTLRWKAEIGPLPGPNPVVGPNGDIYVTSTNLGGKYCGGAAVSGCLIAFSSAGTRDWYFPVSNPESLVGYGISVREDGSVILPTATTGEGTIVTIHALSESGGSLWTYDLNASATSLFPLVDSSGAVYLEGNCNLSQCSSHRLNAIYALSPDGSLKWEVQIVQPGGFTITGISMGQNGVIYAATVNHLLAIGQSETPSTTTHPSSTPATTSAAGGGVPEFPYGSVSVVLLSVAVVASYLFVRNRRPGRVRSGDLP